MSRQSAKRLNASQRFPRVSGDEPTPWGEWAYALMFSPRERG